MHLFRQSRKRSGLLFLQKGSILSILSLHCNASALFGGCGEIAQVLVVRKKAFDHSSMFLGDFWPFSFTIFLEASSGEFTNIFFEGFKAARPQRFVICEIVIEFVDMANNDDGLPFDFLSNN